jgi:hypothetical protein
LTLVPAARHHGHMISRKDDATAIR